MSRGTAKVSSLPRSHLCPCVARCRGCDRCGTSASTRLACPIYYLLLPLAGYPSQRPVGLSTCGWVQSFNVQLVSLFAVVTLTNQSMQSTYIHTYIHTYTCFLQIEFSKGSLVSSSNVHCAASKPSPQGSVSIGSFEAEIVG
jgi:hypothetical protein